MSHTSYLRKYSYRAKEINSDCAAIPCEEVLVPDERGLQGPAAITELRAILALRGDNGVGLSQVRHQNCDRGRHLS